MAYKHFKFEIDNDGIALATLDSPDRSMNIIDAEVMHEWEAIIDEASQNDAIKGVVITSGKKAFGGGADLSMLQNWLENYHEQKLIDKEAATKKLFEDGRILSQLYRKQETCGKPFVAAINGLALGGFTEMILACHARVVAEGLDAKIGLPEVKIGIFPGAGGTQRLPRIIHTQEALQAMLKGSNIIPKKAKSLGLANALVPLDQIVSTAKQLINDGLSPVQPWDQKGFKIPGGKVYSPAGFQLFPAANAIYRRETYDNYPGARAIMKCVYEGLNLPIDLALQVEARYFADVLTTTPASMMLRTLFHSLQAVNKGMRRPKDAPKSDIKKVGIIGGGGFMGAGIGYVSAKAGLDIVLLDRDIQSAEKGRAHCEAIEDKAISKRRSTDAKKHALLEHIEVSADYASLADCDLVIEAVFEDSEVKKLATQQAEKHMKLDAIFASNTSTIPITDLAKNSKDATNF
ncbi:MAG: 3-hydroxyacyl-CoA dehydrogenase NAD-binding domain-containing protein, partial [Nitratireductor sp.]